MTSEGVSEMLRRAAIATVVSLAVLAATTNTAGAALWLVFEPVQAVPGTTVVGATIGEGAAPDAAGQQLPALLVPSGRTVDDPSAGFVRRIGTVDVDADGNGTIRFDVPDIAPGSYALHIDCQSCSPPGSVHAGAFEVLAPLGRGDQTGADYWLLGVVASAVVGGVALVLLRRRKQGRVSA